MSLPVPPSTNALFVQRGRKRVRSKEYRAWYELAQYFCEGAVEGPVAVHICVPENKRRDIDNYAKPVLDLLVKQGVIENDNGRILRQLHMAWHTGEAVEVEVIAL